MKIEFIIPTYNRPNHLMCLLNSLMAQTSDRWTAHVVADCPPDGTLDKIIEYFKNETKIKFTILSERYDDWGHTPRNIGLQQATEDWVILTGEDNYYVPAFVGLFLKEVTPQTHFVYCDMIHNWGTKYIYIVSKPEQGFIDIGNFMTLRKYSQQMQLDPKTHHADYLFVDDYLKKFPYGKLRYIPKPLYVHN